MSGIKGGGPTQDFGEVDFSDSVSGNTPAGHTLLESGNPPDNSDIFDEYFGTGDASPLVPATPNEGSASFAQKLGSQSSNWNSEDLLEFDGVDLGIEDFDLTDLEDEANDVFDPAHDNVPASNGNMEEIPGGGCEHDGDHYIK